MIVRDGKDAVCQECGLLIKRTQSEDGKSSYTHHLPNVPATQAGKDQLDEFFGKCPNLGKEMEA